MSNGNVSRLLGGPPATVLLKLLLVSLLVGAILVWLDLTPFGIFRSIGNLFRSIVANGFDGLREVGRYLVTGAIIVIPIWLLMRIFGRKR